MRTFLCSINDAVWDAVEVGWTKLEATKSTWDKAALAVANANSKALNVISVVSLQKNFTGFLISLLLRKHGRFWRLLMKEQRR